MWTESTFLVAYNSRGQAASTGDWIKEMVIPQ